MGWVFQAPPGWPTPPPSWVPAAGWVADPSWPAAPEGWQFWVAEPGADAALAPPPAEHASWRARCADKHALQAHEHAVAAWRAEQSLADELAQCAKDAATGSSLPGLMVKNGESALWVAQASLIEPRAQPGHYTGAYQGVSFHVAKGVSYRVGASRGTFVPGPEVQTPVDLGEVFVTTTRVVFSGARTTREWAFAKLVNIDTSADDHVCVIHVSNRQKASGVAVGGQGTAMQAYLALALAINQHGVDAAVTAWATAADTHRAAQP